MPHKVARTGVKRSLSSTTPSSKKRRLASGNSAPLNNNKGKQRAYQRTTIPLPDVPDDVDVEDLSDQDVEFFTKNLVTGSFLENLDQTGIARSKKESERLHNLTKPPRVRPQIDDLPSLDSHDEDEESWRDHTEDYDLHSSNNGNDDEDELSSPEHQEVNSDVEQSYERKPRMRVHWDHAKSSTIPRLPIKLPDGRVVETAGRIIPHVESESEDEAGSSSEEQPQTHLVEDVSTGARFGRPGVVDVIGTSSRQTRIQLAKEQIAGICQDILADPESSLGLLRRLHTFSLALITSPKTQTPIHNDPLIRRLAIASQLAVFKDVIPGYRIRNLTDAEKAEKVSQMVARTREWEQGLVIVYQTFLRSLESEIKGKTEFAELALKSMCILLTEATHFNFRTNLLNAIVMRLSKRSWDKSSELCLRTLIIVFKEDRTGVPSLEIVRLLNRMVKERKFSVHPNALSCLLHLRLKSELGDVRASETKADKESRESRNKLDRKRAKGKKVEKPHLSKKAVKAMKEKKEIEGQMQEAEAEIDREERANLQTETLKLLFVLYFRILKAPNWSPLLPAALQGLSRYAHMVNLDFFKDLMHVLKDLITRVPDHDNLRHVEATGYTSGDPIIQHKLHCIVTAFELLSGQGEALNIDLRDFINHLYALILPISLEPDIETVCHSTERRTALHHSTADLLFRALLLAFPIRASTVSTPLRTAAFAKRILVASLCFPAATAIRALEFVQGLLVNEPKLQALLTTEDRTADGIYRPELDDPQLSNPFGTSFWELAHLAESHWDQRVKERALELAQFSAM